jgi:hypothetical protein
VTPGSATGALNVKYVSLSHSSACAGAANPTTRVAAITLENKSKYFTVHLLPFDHETNVDASYRGYAALLSLDDSIHVADAPTIAARIPTRTLLV